MEQEEGLGLAVPQQGGGELEHGGHGVGMVGGEEEDYVG